MTTMQRPRGHRLSTPEILRLEEAFRAEPFTDAATIARRLGIGIQTAQTHRRRMIDAGRLLIASPPLQPAGEPVAPVAADPVEVTRLKGERDRLRGDLSSMTKRAMRAEDLRAGVFGITAEPLEPVSFPRLSSSSPSAESIVLFLSDLHWGEVVSREATDGLNSYDLATARARLGRWAMAVADLATRHWTGPPPERVILILGGDLISGEIHAELAKTNEAKALPAVKDLVAHLVEAIRVILTAVTCPVDVISLAGNHGRSTLKPEAKEAAETSYDTLVSDFLEMALAGDGGRLTFYTPASPDALFSVFGWRFLATHGDKIGSRGGQGLIGPAATAARGFKRITQDYSTRGIPLDLILIGHFHTALQLEEGFVNGSLVGWGEYSRDGRFRPAPARQLFLTVHPRRLLAQVRWIDVGHPDEGLLYQAPPEDRPLRPRYRVKAVGARA